MEEVLVGKVTNFFVKISVAAIKVTAEVVKIGDTLHFKGQTTDFKETVTRIESENQSVDEARPGETVEVLLTWLLPKPLPPVDYTAFVHLHDSQGRNVAQSDVRLVWGGDIPTAYRDGLLTTWRGLLGLPSDLAPGDYDLKAGLYDLTTMERAGVVDDASGENTVDVGSLTVVKP